MLYRQLARILVLRYPGQPQVKSIRPHRELSNGNVRFLDTDEEPTLVELTGEERGLRVDLLLKTGAIAPYSPSEDGEVRGTYGVTVPPPIRRVPNARTKQPPARSPRRRGG